MPRRRIERIQDPIHGMMEFEGVESVVIDILRTPELQRLRRIHQTGLAYFVFPGMEHSRLIHSLGTSYLAIKFGRHLEKSSRDFLIDTFRPNDSSIRDVAVAALCHDLGHGPFSHAWEREVIGVSFDKAKWIKSLGLEEFEEEVKELAWHELITQGLMNWHDGQLHKLLEMHDEGSSNRIRRLLLGISYQPYLKQLLSSDVDIDRADYLVRDTIQSGVTYGLIDIDRLVSACKIGDYNGRLVVGFDSKKSQQVIEQFVTARKAMYETVYYHKTVRAAEGMLALFLKRLKVWMLNDKLRLDNPSPSLLLRIISGEALKPAELLCLDDFNMWTLIEDVVREGCADKTLVDLGYRIIGRDLFKLAHCRSEDIRNFISKQDNFMLLHDEIRPHCPGDPEFYFFVDNVSFHAVSTDENKRGYLIDDSNKATPFSEHPSLVHLANKSFDYARIFTIKEAVESVQKLISHNKG